MNVPYLSFDQELADTRADSLKAVEAFLDSKYYILGPKVREFEAQFAAYCGTQHAVGVASGLDALHIAMNILGLSDGDEVIVPSNTYIASWMAASYVGATIVPVEPRMETSNIDPEKIEAAITPHTKAILVVHLYGQSCEMERIMAIAQKYNLFVLEDNAQAQGARYDGKTTGSFGHINGTSFYPSKNLGAVGDAGAITTDNATWADDAKMWRNYGSHKRYYNRVIGLNSRLDELQAALLLPRLAKLDSWNAQRQKAAAWYNERLAGIPDLRCPLVADKATSVYHIYAVHTPQRDALQAFLSERGVGSLIHYPLPPHLQDAYADLGWEKGAFPIAEELAATELSLPIFPGISEAQVDYVAEQIRQFFH